MAVNRNIDEDAAAAMRASAWEKGVLIRGYNQATAEQPLTDQERRNEVVTEEADKRFKEFQLEESETDSGRIRKFTHNTKSTEAMQAENRKREAANGQMFYLAAMAAAYDRPITLDFGSGPTDTTLGEVRESASELYNEYAQEYRRLIEEGADEVEIARAKAKMDYYQNIMDTADDVAAERKPPEAMQTAIDADKEGSAELGNNLDGVENAQTLDEASIDKEAENAGTLEGLSAEQQDDANMAAFFGMADEHPASFDEKQAESAPLNDAPDFGDIDIAAVVPQPPSGPGF